MTYSESSSVIQARILSRVTDIDTSEGSFMSDAQAASSEEFALTRQQLDEVLKRVFAETAAANGYSEELRLRAAEKGVNWRPGTKAGTPVQFTGTDNAVIPKDFVVQTESGLRYLTSAPVTVAGGTATCDVTAELIGVQYNVGTGMITQIPVRSVPGISAVTNLAPAVGGTDPESDEALLERYLEKVQMPATSGNVAHYKQWAKSVPGVGDVRVQPLWNGDGTVRVIIVDSDKAPASPAIVEAVSEYVEAERPIGALVTYQAAGAAAINTTAALTLQEGYTLEGVQSAVEDAVDSYLKSIAFKQDYVSHAQVGVAILGVPGILDYSALTLNGGAGNVAIVETDVAVKGTVVLSAA